MMLNEVDRGQVAEHARSVTAKRTRVCRTCGYDKFVQCCHIKAVAKFPRDTLVAVVNHPENLVLLCPNCHWEFDHGLLSLDAGEGFEPSISGI